MPHTNPISNTDKSLERQLGQDFPLDSYPEAASLVLEVWKTAPVETGTHFENPERLKNLWVQLVQLKEGVTPLGTFPEVAAAATWLDLCLQQHEAGSPRAIHLEWDASNLLSQPLWEPAQAWVFRMLASLGKRREIAAFLPRNAPFTLPQAEACLEAHYLAAQRAVMLEQLLQPGAIHSQYPDEIKTRWQELILCEVELYLHPEERDIEDRLMSLQENQFESTVAGWFLAEHQRITARSGAALVRFKLGRNKGDSSIIETASLHYLPGWEQSALRGMVYLSQDKNIDAKNQFQSILSTGIHQSIILYGLSCVLSKNDPLQALDNLTVNNPTWQISIASAALLARLELIKQSSEMLQQAGQMPSEAVRWSWGNGDGQILQQEQLLRSNIYLVNKNLTEAERLVNTAYPKDLEKQLRLARSTFAAWNYLKLNPLDNSWGAEVVHQKVQRNQALLSRIPAAGNADLQFYKAVLQLEKEPLTSFAALESLLHLRSWCEAERDAGGARLVYLADTLLEACRPDLADQALNWLAQENWIDHYTDWILPRIALTKFYLDWRSGFSQTNPAIPAFREVEDSTAVVDLDLSLGNLMQATPGILSSAPLAAAVGLVSGSNRTPDILNEARSRGSPDAVCQVLEHLSSNHLSSISNDVQLQLPRPLRLLYIMAVTGSQGVDSQSSIEEIDQRLSEFINYFGANWLDFSPVDPRHMLRKFISQAIKKGRWDCAQKWAVYLEQAALLPDKRFAGKGGVSTPAQLEQNEDFSIDLSMRLRMLQAVETALAGDYEQAAEKLAELEGG